MSAVISEAPVLGELAARLQSDADGTLRAEYCDLFAAACAGARQRLHLPLTFEEFETNAALAEAADLSAEVISTVWSALHP